MGHTYTAHAILGIRITQVHTILRRLENLHMTETLGCDKTDCQAKKLESVGMPFCSTCGKPSITKELPDDKCTDEYIPGEWFDKVLEGTEFTFSVMGEHSDGIDHQGVKRWPAYDHSAIYVGIGCETDPYPEEGCNHDGFIGMKQFKKALGREKELRELLTKAFGGLNHNPSEFGVWAVLS